MTERFVHVFTLLGLCAIAAIYPVVLIRTTLAMLARDVEGIQKGWWLCLSAGVLVAALLILGSLR